MTEENSGILDTVENVASGGPHQPVPEGGGEPDLSPMQQSGADVAAIDQRAAPLPEAAVDNNTLPADSQPTTADDAALQYYATPQQDYPVASPAGEPAFVQVSPLLALAFFKHCREVRYRIKYEYDTYLSI